MIKNLFNKRTKLARGFTLIELLVVISIIGMLASVVLVSLQGARSKAKDTKLILELKELQKAMELYKLDNGRYPGDGYWHAYTDCGFNRAANGDVHTLGENGMFDATFRSKYMSSLPQELASCGLRYVNISGTMNVTDYTCIASGPAGDITIHPDGFDGTFNPDGSPKRVGDSYAYLIIFTSISNPSRVSYPALSNANAVERCIFGPKI
jgi:prepilin-type N-terminal cleavage/methylation domain-containing protein